MTTYVPELNKEEKTDKVSLTADRDAYEALKDASLKLYLDIDKVRAVALLGERCFDFVSGLDPSGCFEDPVSCKEYIDMFRSLTTSFEVVLDLLVFVEQTAESVDHFCTCAKEGK